MARGAVGFDGEHGHLGALRELAGTRVGLSTVLVVALKRQRRPEAAERLRRDIEKAMGLGALGGDVKRLPRVRQVAACDAECRDASRMHPIRVSPAFQHCSHASLCRR